MSKDVRNHVYFSKPEGVCKQNSLGNNNLEDPAAVILRVDPSTCLRVLYMFHIHS